ncbi:NAD-P-binding protein [Leucosporidium creatinivorum]|uniref:NAD-P-binding protein n=1 Tax=Leucosporidium creatinivorum TaxID=106004 RepID=A0A1Y2DUE7_9BASI|nr:NAD-P-binding protein [Leucosporidium creatinivorum]
MPAPSLSTLKADNLFNLEGVVAVITGGSSGIGAMLASTLLANGARVYVVGLDQKEVDEFATKYNVLAGDVGSSGSIIGCEAKRLAELIASREQYVTCLFNNAGITGPASEYPEKPDAKSFVECYFDGLSEDDFKKVHSVNSVGPFFLTLAFLPLLEASKQAPYGDKFQPQIINTSSMNGWTKDPITSGRSWAYLASKAAIASLTPQLAHDFLPLGVRVNSIAPGWFVTGMSAPGSVDSYGVTNKPELQSESMGFKTPVGGSGGPKDVGSVALSLLVNRFINGETILVDGGTLLVHPSSY